MLRRVLGRAEKRPPAAAAATADPEAATTSPADRRIIERAAPYTMTGRARLQALIDGVRYCVDRSIPGGFAECGVWRGGSVLAMLLTLQELQATDRDVHLFDTFEGMTAPTAHDVSPFDPPARETWDQALDTGQRAWPQLFDPDVFSEEDVRRTLLGTGYPPERLHFVRGPVEQTLPARAPTRLALLRLDTDWYESTRAGMDHLFPRLSEGGVLIVDDYGHWAGAQRAVDEHFDAHGGRPLLSRIDYTGRIGVKR
jgi:hypothetical protein